MKMFVAFFALAFVAVSFAAPGGQAPEAVLVKETQEHHIGDGKYGFGYDLSNGESRQESAELQNAGSDQEAFVVKGSYGFVDEKTNQQYSVKYTADKNGFHAEGAHIPV